MIKTSFNSTQIQQVYLTFHLNMQMKQKKGKKV
jgi:hypothetical protein